MPNASSPPVLRLDWGTCGRCGRYSSMCAKVSVRVGGWQSKRFDRAVMTCPICRERNRGNWRMSPDWQPASEHPQPKYDKVFFEKWKLENPPLDETFEDDDD